MEDVTASGLTAMSVDFRSKARCVRWHGLTSGGAMHEKPAPEAGLGTGLLRHSHPLGEAALSGAGPNRFLLSPARKFPWVGLVRLHPVSPASATLRT
jgi:hypothetical protein